MITLLHQITKNYFGVLSRMLDHIDADRYFYPLMVIVQHKEGITQKTLSDILQVDKVTMNRMVNYFAKGGYITRETCTVDKRNKYIKPTEKAIADTVEIARAFREIDRCLMQNISEPDSRAYFKVTNQLIDNVSSMPMSPVKVNYSKILK